MLTPHGDRKPARVRPDDRHVYDLITPHGDRKLGCATYTAGADGACRLITPHGDRKRGQLGSRSSRSVPSTAHYPSWGSKTRNCSGRGRASATCSCSLPLMGIENKTISECRTTCGLIIGLITPHGDRKPEKLIVFSVRWRRGGPHYPSWGSKTRAPASDAYAEGLNLRLITPHGDRKPRCPPARARLLSRRSELITPHGDRKHSEREVRDRFREALHSLPLMGIENRQ